MKIEKINDYQMQFTLSEADMKERKISLLEMAYGSHKTSELFQEMIEKAEAEYDFQHSEGTPLLIEAVPLSFTDVMITITRIENGNDLSHRLGYPSFLSEGGSDAHSGFILDNMMGSLDAISKLSSSSFLGLPNLLGDNKAPNKTSRSRIVIKFDSFDYASSGAARLVGLYNGTSSLYKFKNKFYLVCESARYKFSQNMANIISEYGSLVSDSAISKTFLQEYGDTIIKKNAIKILATL